MEHNKKKDYFLISILLLVTIQLILALLITQNILGAVFKYFVAIVDISPFFIVHAIISYLVLYEILYLKVLKLYPNRRKIIEIYLLIWAVSTIPGTAIGWAFYDSGISNLLALFLVGIASVIVIIVTLLAKFSAKEKGCVA